MMTGHLIHIGYPKTGSNFLRSWFASHPQIAFLDGGIAGFGNVYAIPRDAADQKQGIRLRVTSSEALATPHQSVGMPIKEIDTGESWRSSAQVVACSTLVSLFPNAHVLLVTRGFRSMIVSSYSQYVRTGWDLSFGSFCTTLERESRRGNLPWNYDRMIDLYVDAFGRDQLLVMPYELLRDNAEAFTSNIEAKFGLGAHTVPPRRINPSISAEEMVWYPRLTRRLRALPVGSRFRRRIMKRYLQGTMTNRFRWPIRILNRLSPVHPVDSSDIPSALITTLARGAERLREMPLYSPYASDYLE